MERSGALSRRTVVYRAQSSSALTPRCRAANRLTDPITVVPGHTDFNPYSPLHDPRLMPIATSTTDFLLGPECEQHDTRRRGGDKSGHDKSENG